LKEERVVLVTGSATGLGAEIIKSFAAKGFRVVINYFADGDADSLNQEIEASYGETNVLAYQADVADRQQVRAMFDETIKRFGRVDVLVNCAGI